MHKKTTVALAGKLASVGVDIFERLLIIPIFISAVGSELYADWAVLYAFSMMFGVLDLGLVQYFSNLLLDKSKRGSRAEYWETLARARKIYGFLFVFNIAAVLLVCYFGAGNVLRANSLTAGAASWIFAYLAIAVAANIPRSLLLDNYRVAGDYEKVVVSVTILKVVRLSFLVVSVGYYRSLELAAFSYTFITVAVGIIGITIMQRSARYPAIFRSPRFSGSQVIYREDVIKSFSFFVRQCGRLGSQQLPLVILGLFGVGSIVLVQFIVVRALTGVVRQLITQLSDAIGMGVSEAWYTGDRGSIGSTVKRSCEILSCISGGLLMVLTLYVPDILSLWLEKDASVDYVLFAILSSAVMLSVPSLPCLSVLHFTNHSEVLAKIFSVKILVLLSTLPLFVFLFSSRGAAASVLLVEGVLGSYYIIKSACKIIDLNSVDIMKSAAIYMILGAAVIIMGNFVVDELPVGGSRLFMSAWLIVRFAVLAAVLASAVLLIAKLNPNFRRSGAS